VKFEIGKSDDSCISGSKFEILDWTRHAVTVVPVQSKVSNFEPEMQESSNFGFLILPDVDLSQSRMQHDLIPAAVNERLGMRWRVEAVRDDALDRRASRDWREL
jgi:hypothetical protein